MPFEPSERPRSALRDLIQQEPQSPRSAVRSPQGGNNLTFALHKCNR